MVSGPSGISNIPVYPADISNASVLYGAKPLDEVRGKTVRMKPDRVRTDVGTVEVPRGIYNQHQFVTLTADVMFVNGVPFLVTLSRQIRLRTAEHIPTRSASQLSSSLIKVCRMYERGGFTVKMILMDQEFTKLEGALGLVEINTTAAREHVGEIERDIRTQKEQARTITSTLPYHVLPKQYRASYIPSSSVSQLYYQ